jgi:hypothetical protein
VQLRVKARMNRQVIRIFFMAEIVLNDQTTLIHPRTRTLSDYLWLSGK